VDSSYEIVLGMVISKTFQAEANVTCVHSVLPFPTLQGNQQNWMNIKLMQLLISCDSM
jgi:hypothetical protein